MPASCRLHPGRLHRQLRSLRTGSVSGCLWGQEIVCTREAGAAVSGSKSGSRRCRRAAREVPRTAGWHDEMFLKRSAVSGQIASYLASGWPLFSGPLKTPKPALFKCWFRIQISPPPASQKGSVTLPIDAGVAQLAEQLFCKQQVTGSIPVAGSKGMCWFV